MTQATTPDSLTSQWPLPVTGVRFLTPQVLVHALEAHTLAQDLYPLALGFYPSAAGHRMRRRRNASYLLIYCTAGRGTLHINGSNKPVGPGDIVVLRAGQSHAYAADQEDPWSIFWVHYSGVLSSDYTAFLSGDEAIYAVGVQPRLITLFQQLLSIKTVGFSLSRFVQSSCQLKSLLTELGCSATERHANERKRFDLEAVLDQMRANLHADLDLDALAATASLSKFHFIRCFKAVTGQSPIQQFIQMKMQLACTLLDNSSEPIQSVASKVGYNDALYFSRIFKRLIGMPPTRYRQQHSI